MDCPRCGHGETWKHGKRNDLQRYRCKSCLQTFTDNGALPGRRIPPQAVGVALSTFFEGMSYRDIERHLETLYGLSVSPSTIYRWVVDYTQRGDMVTESYKANTGGTWVADETSLKIDGKNIWVWNLMDAKTRFLLSTHISETRTEADAIKLLREGRDRAANLPSKIVTDKLPAYVPAIKRVFWRGTTDHQQSEGIKAKLNNNMSERLQGTVKERTKVMRGLEREGTAEQFLDGFRLYYNYLKPHQTTKRTPAAKAGISAPFSSWIELAYMKKPKPRRKRDQWKDEEPLFRTRREF